VIPLDVGAVGECLIKRGTAYDFAVRFRVEDGGVSAEADDAVGGFADLP
jgi:hypothetical protein